MSADKQQPWDRLPGESAKAYEAFSIYRDMGAERSTAKAREKLGKNLRTIEGWCSQWDWVERCRKRDIHLDKEAQKILEKQERDEIVKMNRRQIKTTRTMQDLISLDIDVLAQQVTRWQKAGADIDTFPLKDIPIRDRINLYKTGFEGERVIRGEVTNITKTEEKQQQRQVIVHMSNAPPTMNGEQNRNNPQTEPESKDSPRDIRL